MLNEVVISENKLFYKYEKEMIMLTEKNIFNFFRTNFYFEKITLEKAFELFQPFKNIINEINNIDFDLYYEELKQETSQKINCDICISNIFCSTTRKYYSGTLGENKVYVADKEITIPDFESSEISLFNNNDIENRASYSVCLNQIKDSKIVMKDIFFTKEGSFIKKKDNEISLYDFIKLIFGFAHFSPDERKKENEKLKKMIEEAFLDIEKGNLIELKYPKFDVLIQKAEKLSEKYNCPVIIEDNNIIVITNEKSKINFSFEDMTITIFKTEEEYKFTIPKSVYIGHE